MHRAIAINSWSGARLGKRFKTSMHQLRNFEEGSTPSKGRTARLGQGLGVDGEAGHEFAHLTPGQRNRNLQQSWGHI